MGTPKTKVCYCCKTEQPSESFHRNRNTKDGLSQYCRPCAAKKSREWRIKHGLPVRGERDSREVRNAKALARYHANREQIARRRIDEYDHIIEIERASKKRNKAKYRPVKNAQQSIRNRILNGSESVILKRELRRLYAQPCSECGAMEGQSLDHIVPLSRGGRHSIGNLMTLCLRCNMSKGARFLVEWRQAKRLVAA